MQLKKKPLEGLKVLEMGSLIAGPFAGKLFAEFGAEVIKIESPGNGDPLRKWRKLHNGTSLWWYIQSRNKKSVSVNLKIEEGIEIIQDLVREVDIVVENFRPGVMEKWGLGYEDLKKINPGIIMVRISGYGQDGPYRDKAGFGSIAEAMGGLRYLTGYPDRPTTRIGISIGDSIAALYGVIGAMFAVYHRDVKGTGEGQYIDVALYEAVFSLMESMVPEYDVFNYIRERSGSTLPGIAPSNTYRCKDEKYIVIGANGDAIFKRLMYAIGKPNLAEDPKFETNDGRVAEADYLDEVIELWTSQHELKEAITILDQARVPAGPIYNVKDIIEDEHVQSRNLIKTMEIEDLGTVKFPGIVPKLSETPGDMDWVGPQLGFHNDEVLKELLQYSVEKIASLREQEVIFEEKHNG
ncbi:CaiB/BaiF CoA-transferase family protein [Sporosarcina pasteurii]|uniref:Formyl-coenzyme A transferase n=1 Tax=Sporosarcina pasteurii TaxID=1474 RepID=A0A380BDA2_SPOPA|nr:CaiB/BaiF CoA-transferase family protein [Sporosarcina pasteurii]MDS9472550.1 CaiB/BaiF CoA-transferase family protein [Sporosarcina pasteurii]QBQ06103.1 CoA transferase [Sporosarcina pasteurii]SUI99432.1 Formyl-coenzyme A transferase [Sporosarcina pasteurii]